MTALNPQEVIKKLEKDGKELVRHKMSLGTYAKWKLPIIWWWLEYGQAEEEFKDAVTEAEGLDRTEDVTLVDLPDDKTKLLVVEEVDLVDNRCVYGTKVEDVDPGLREALDESGLASDSGENAIKVEGLALVTKEAEKNDDDTLKTWVPETGVDPDSGQDAERSDIAKKLDDLEFDQNLADVITSRQLLPAVPQPTDEDVEKAFPSTGFGLKKKDTPDSDVDPLAEEAKDDFRYNPDCIVNGREILAAEKKADAQEDDFKEARENLHNAAAELKAEGEDPDTQEDTPN